MTEQKQNNKKTANKTNIWMVVGVIGLAMIAFGLIIVLANALTTDESEVSGPPIGDQSVPVSGEPQVEAIAAVNVRSGPGTQYDIYGVLPAGSTATVRAVCTDFTWWAIEVPVPDGYGWVSGDYVRTSFTETVPLVDCPEDSSPVPTAPPDQPAVTATAVVNVRSGPGTTYNSYGMLQPGQSATATGKTTNPEGELWYQIFLPTAPGGIGWVSGEFVEVSGAELLPEL